MKPILLSLLSVMLLISCTENEEVRLLFEHVESVMNERPDSALTLLDNAALQKNSYTRQQRMRYELLHAKAQNKAYVDFSTDSVMKEVVEYYDVNGTANEQMEAHYLLGCTYRDLHESPLALSCYLDAVGRADTLSSECNYDMLMRVWGQIADEYEHQAMPYKELESNAQYKHYALKCKDTMNYIIGVELDRRAYFMLGDTANTIKSAERAIKLFEKNRKRKRCRLVNPTYPSNISQ